MRLLPCYMHGFLLVYSLGEMHIQRRDLCTLFCVASAGHVESQAALADCIVVPSVRQTLNLLVI